MNSNLSEFAGSNDWTKRPLDTARLALSCLDLTSLNAADSEADIAALCGRAQGRFGTVAAVCVWPRLAAFARQQLPATIAVAAVANFPDGGADVQRAVRDAEDIVQSGAQEVDLVLPYHQLLAGDEPAVARLLTAVRKATEGLKLKVILETGMLVEEAYIRLAARMSLDAGADFLKTSTGKTAVSATPAAARIMLGAIAEDAGAANRVGFKPSGGIRTVADVAQYMAVTEALLGTAALNPQRFRIGASSVLADIEAVLAGNRGAEAASAEAY